MLRAMIFFFLFVTSILTYSATLQTQSQHFILYHSKQIHHHLIESTLNLLEEIYHKISGKLNFTPSRPIKVIIYNAPWEFVQETGQPNYIAAVYDGRLRMQNPALLKRRGILKSTLTHEYVHLAIEGLTDNAIPLWFNEGLALYLSDENPTSSSQLKIDSLKQLDMALKNKKSKLELDFAYSISLKMVRKLVKSYSWATIVALLHDLKNIPFEKAVRKHFHLSLEELEKIIFKK